ncbi:antitoxin VapB family protein [Salinarchaeum laminariae]|uniref:antitoxin VapB family protein n=1 Tax=Salinarchaeum laminariae TaxID=869888 RepID=UPI0020C108F6|nr:antitoxin VapB family protein [Salinarchaeum laminariae]
MGTKTISLADDAYERLKRHKREGESFSDVVRRLTGDDFFLRDYYGALDDTGEELDRIVAARREARSDTHRERVDRIVEELEK